MHVTIHSILPGGLCIITRPRGHDWLEVDLQSLKRAGITVLISLLTDVENDELGLTQEARVAGALGITVLRLPVHDRETPAAIQSAHALIRDVVTRIAGGTHVAIHCRQGIGRSSLLAAAVLVHRGLSASDAWQQVHAARGRPVPDTDAQRAWVDRYATWLNLHRAAGT